jgi:GNAT superfamily N-acetyltransferase
MEIRIAETDKEINRCHGTMSQLRPQIKKDDFLPRVREQEKNGYKLAFIEGDGQVVSVAGFRISETLAWGKFVYVDDLITDEDQRSKGYGDKLIDWLMEYARENQCREFHLDSGVQRFLAHRFYFRKGLTISGYHFEHILN